ncbi:MAG: hypothetical protein RL328_2824 [Acidobacteriota bacterium]|jgi:hypothetical protein
MRQNLPIILGALVIFAAVSGIIVHFMPEPVEDTDYLIAGSAGTLAALLVLFLALVSTRMKSNDVFFKKRKKGK